MKNIIQAYCLTGCLLVVIAASSQPADAQFVWSGASGSDLNWLTAGNWSPSGPPGAPDDVHFFDVGATNDIVSIDNVVSADTTVQSLWYGQTNGIHNTLIAPGVTLTLAGTGAGNILTAGTETDNGGSQGETNTISGAGATLLINNPNGIIAVRQGVVSAGSTASLRSTLNLSGLDNFNSTIGRLLVGSESTFARPAGTLFLARTNVITAGGSSPAIAVGGNGGGSHNSGNASFLYLGQMNTINASSITVGRVKQGASGGLTSSILFNPALVSPMAYFRGADGVSRIPAWTLADAEAGSGSGTTAGICDFTGGTVDAMVNVMTLGRQTGSHSPVGTLTFEQGTFDINTLILGEQTQSSTYGGNGTINVNGSANLIVQNNLELTQTVGGTGAAGSTGTLNMNGGTTKIAGDITDGGGIGTLNVNLGVLDMQPAGDPTPGSITADTLAIGNSGTAVVTNAASISASSITIGFGGSIAGNTSIDIGNTGVGLFDSSAVGGFTLNGTFQGSGTVSGDFIQSPGTAIIVGGAGAAGMLNFYNNLTLGGGTLAFDLSSSAAGANDTTYVYGNLNLTGTNDVVINATEGDLDATTPYTLINYYGSLSGDATYFRAVGPLSQSRRTFSFDTTTMPNAVTMTVGGSTPVALTWRGDGTGNIWDIHNTANWNNGTTSDQFYNLDAVLFDDTGSNSPAINLTESLAPGAITVNNAVEDYTFGGSGALTGNPALNKAGAAALTIANDGANAFGALTLDDGALAFANSGANSFGDITINGGALTFSNRQPNTYSGNLALNAGSLTLNLNADTTLASAITGAGTLVKQNTNVLVLSGDNSLFDGPITVNAGVLKIGDAVGLNQDSTALGSVNGGTLIADGATLDVNGYNLESEPVTVSGAGVNGEGAIVENTGDPAFHSPGGANLAYVTLAGDTTFGGTGRLDFRSNPSSGTNAAFYTGGQPYKITLVGTNQIQFTGVQIDPALGDIDVQEGTLGIETSTTLGNSASNLFVHAGSRLLFYQLYSPVEKQVHLSGDGTNDTIYAQSSQNAGQNILAGPIDITGNCRINVASGYDLTFSNIVSGTGGLTLTAAGTLHLTGMAANTWSGGLTINAGRLQVGDGQADGSIPATAITNNGALVFNSANDLVVADEISGTGTLEQDGPGKLTLTGTDTFTGATTVNGGMLQVDGSMIGNGGVTVSGGTLAGSGTLLGNVSIQTGGTLAPGDSIATFNIIGSLTLAGTNEMQLSKSGSTLTNDMITGISSLTLGGTLMLDISGDALAVGDSFQLYSATFIVPGSFADIEPAQPGAGLAWDTSELASQGILKVAGTASGAPAIGGVSVAGGNVMFTVTGGTAGATLYVLSSTNLAAPLANWTSVETNQFDANGNFSFTNAVDDQPQQFYIIQQQ